MATASDWRSLSSDILVSISERLTCIADYLHFRSVCSSWRSVLPRNAPLPSCFICLAHPQTASQQLPHVPWLVAHRKDEHGDHTIYSFFTFSSDQLNPSPLTRLSRLQQLKQQKEQQLRVYRLSRIEQLPATTALAAPCCGSSHGWMALLDPTPSIIFFNPVTWSHLCLPSLANFPNVFGNQYYKDGEDYVASSPHLGETSLSFQQMAPYLANKVVLSSDPTASDCIAVTICCWWQRLAFCRLGDDEWTPISSPEFRSYNIDVLFYQEQFYVACYHNIFRCDIGPNPKLKHIPMA